MLARRAQLKRTMLGSVLYGSRHRPFGNWWARLANATSAAHWPHWTPYMTLGTRDCPLFGTMAWSARQLLRFESALRRGMPPSQAAQAAGAPPFRANELADQCRKANRLDLERWLEAIARVDLALKGASKRPPKAVLEHAVLSLCKSPRSPSASSRYPA